MGELSGVTALILAGGLGTRLRSVVGDRSKVVAEVLGRPFLSYLLDQLEEAGVRRALLCTGHLEESVRRLGESHRGLSLAFSSEESPLGTGGALRKALAAADGDAFLALNGDSFCGVDLGAFWASWSARESPGSLVLVRSPDPSRFGRVETDAGGRVTAFREKDDSGGPGWINAGVYGLGRSLLESIPPGRPVSLEREVLPAWIGRGLRGWRVDAPFVDIGTPDGLALAADVLASRREGGPPPRRGFVVLDRDGTVNVERNYLSRVEELELLPGAAAGLARMQAMGLGLVLVTNQSAVGRGLLSPEGLERIHERLRELLAREGVRLDAILSCPHRPEDACSCRKPLPGLLLRAAADLGFAPGESVVIGDKACDLEMGAAVGARTILVRTGYGAATEASPGTRPDHVVDDLPGAALLLGELLPGSGGPGAEPRGSVPRRPRAKRSLEDGEKTEP